MNYHRLLSQCLLGGLVSSATHRVLSISVGCHLLPHLKLKSMVFLDSWYRAPHT